MQADFSVELGRGAPALEIPWCSDDPQVRYYDLKNHPELVQQIPEVVAYPELGGFLSRINAAGFPLATAKCDVWSSSEVAQEEEIFGDRKFVSYIDLVFIEHGDQRSFEKHEAFAKELCRLLSHAPEIAATVELVIRHCYFNQEGFVSENSAEPNSPRSSAIVEDIGTSLPKNIEDATNHYGRPDVAADEHGDLAPQGKGFPDGGVLNKSSYFEEPNASITGFCLTAYVTGFGDSDHDPLRRWTICLNLLQHAIVQLNSDSQPKP